MVVAVVGVHAAQAGVVLEDVVAVELVAGEMGVLVCLLLDGNVVGGSYRVNHVAFGSGFAGRAILNIVSDSERSKLRPSCRAVWTCSFVRFKPSRWRNPWFANVFIIGQGPRATICQLDVSTFDRCCSMNHRCQEQGAIRLAEIGLGRRQCPPS